KEVESLLAAFCMALDVLALHSAWHRHPCMASHECRPSAVWTRARMLIRYGGNLGSRSRCLASCNSAEVRLYGLTSRGYPSPCDHGAGYAEHCAKQHNQAKAGDECLRDGRTNSRRSLRINARGSLEAAESVHIGLKLTHNIAAQLQFGNR